MLRLSVLTLYLSFSFYTVSVEMCWPAYTTVQKFGVRKVSLKEINMFIILQECIEYITLNG